MALATAVGSDEQEGDGTQLARRPAKLAENAKAAHMRHVDVAQDQVRSFRELPDPFDTIGRHDGFEPLVLQHFDQQFDRRGIVLDAEDL